MIIDDYEESIALIKTYFLGTEHTFLSANSGEEGLELAYGQNPDLILLDVIMPGMDGFEVADRLKANIETQHIPIIMITGLEDNRSRSRCFQMGVEYITKPFNIFDIKMRVDKLLELKSYKEQLKSAERLIFELAMIAENKDAYEEGSVQRLAHYGMYFAKHLSLSKQEVNDVGKGALLHNVGKIEIEDQILSKPGPLTQDEFEKIKSYPEKGERLCRPIESLKNVLPIIRHHKELFDGSGYPDNLNGNDIPLNAQIISLAGIYNAMTARRPYRKAMSSNEALTAMDNDAKSGKINPELYTEFKEILQREGIHSNALSVKDFAY